MFLDDKLDFQIALLTKLTGPLDYYLNFRWSDQEDHL